MAGNYTYPGVYIEEFAPGAPIQGIGTSTPAFIGLLGYGPSMEVTRITSFDAFLDTFSNNGTQRVAPEDTDYLWYGVSGFFQNGGQTCYIVRVSNERPDEATLDDRATPAKPTMRVIARTPGDNSGDPTKKIEVTIEDTHAITGAQLYNPSATITSAAKDSTSILVSSADDARRFLSGNSITVKEGAKSEVVTVVRVEDTTIRVAEKLQNTYGAGTVHLAPLRSGVDDTFRVSDGQGLATGSVITLTQGGTQATGIVNSVQGERISSSETTYRVTLKEKLTADLDPAATVTVKSEEFKLTVDKGGSTVNTYDNLSMDPAHPRYFATIINGDPNGLITAQPVDPPNTTTPPNNRPTENRAAAGSPPRPITLSGGVNYDPSKIGATDYQSALKLLEPVKAVSLVVAPGLTDTGLQSDILDHCTRMKDRFAILDSARGEQPFGALSVETHRNGLQSPGGYGALYYPWLQVRSLNKPDANRMILVPPSGYVAGIYARIDNARGVHKAPAGNEAVVNGAVAVERMLSDTDQGVLNLQNVNVIRVFQNGGRPVVWGARTLVQDKDTRWQYVNVRRLFIYLEGSISQSIRWAVFEPNTPQLWGQLRRTITDFLTSVWRDGAIFGEKASDAFYVRIDDVLNPFSEQALGRLYIEIGVRPSYPAEFVVLRIGIWPGGSEVSEG